MRGVGDVGNALWEKKKHRSSRCLIELFIREF